jgi:uncharacterized protein YggE
LEQPQSLIYGQTTTTTLLLPDEKPTVSVIGIAEKQIPTDQAKISLAVENTASDTSTASKTNSDKMNKIISALITKGLNNKNISTSSFEIRPNYDNQNNNYNKILSYTAINKVTITTSSNVNISSFIDLALNNGANRIENIEFVTSQKVINDNYNGLLKDAFDNAKQKAQALAAEGGFVLNGVKKIDLSTDNGNTPSPIPYFSSLDQNSASFAQKAASPSSNAAASASASAPAPTQILPQENKISINLPVTFYIKNGSK